MRNFQKKETKSHKLKKNVTKADKLVEKNDKLV